MAKLTFKRKLGTSITPASLLLLLSKNSCFSNLLEASMYNGAIHFPPSSQFPLRMSRAKNWLFLCSSTKISPVMDQGLDGHSMDCDMESSNSSNVHRLSASMHKATASSLRSSDLAPLRKSQKRPTGPSPLVRLPKSCLLFQARYPNRRNRAD